MAETVGQHSVAAFTSPVNGTSPIDANTVKGNDNTIRSAYVDHDADPGIHVQSSTLASRPVANSAGRKWMTQDSGVIRLFYDDGTNWYEVDYLRTTGGTISGNLAITGTLAVTGVATFTAQPILSSLTASRAVFTDGSKGLVSNAITGTGDVVMSASPTLTGTITAASATLSGTLGVSGLLTFASLKGTGATTVTNILDEDNMASDSATALATQQSIKAYVDAQVGASDALSEVLAIGNTTGANDIIVSAGQKIRTPAVAAQDGSSAITIANTTGALTLATALADSNLATISTAGKVSNSATTATDANTASAIVARDASGNFTAGTITAALTGNASTATTLQTARNINGVSFNGSADITVTAAAGTLTGTTLASNVTASSLTSVGTLANLTVTNPITGSVTGSSGSTTGNAATATALQTARNINGVSFNGTADITVAAAAGTLTGTTLASGVTASSLTSVGTLSSLTVSGDLTVDTSTLKVDSTQNRVGVNTTTPNDAFQVVGTAVFGADAGYVGTGSPKVVVYGDGGTETSALWFQGGVGSALAGLKASDSKFYITNTYAGNALGTNGIALDQNGNLAVDTNTLYVDAANNRVGVGTASPGFRSTIQHNFPATFTNAAGDYAFMVQDDAPENWLGVAGQTTTDKWVGLITNGSPAPSLVFGTGGSERMRIDTSGRLGIGTASPGYLLDVQRSGSGFVSRVGTASLTNLFTYTDSNSAYLSTDTSLNNAIQISNGSNAIAFFTQSNAAAKATLDASGNLGLGASPQAKFHMQGGDFLKTNTDYVAGSAGSGFLISQGASSGNTYTQLVAFQAGNTAYNNIVIPGGNLGIGTTSPNAQLHLNGAANISCTNTANTSGFDIGLLGGGSDPIAYIYQRATSAIAFGTSNTTRMTLDASGNLGVGTTSPTDRLDVRGVLAAGNGTVKTIISYSTVGIFGTESNHALSLITNATERARITSGGYFKASNTGVYLTTGNVHELRSNASDGNVIEVTNSSASPYGIALNFISASPDNNTNAFLSCGDSTTSRCYIYSDGDLANHDGVYGTISDERLKQDIVDAGSQWDDLKAVRFRKYRMKTDVEANPDAPFMLGVVAQELEQTSPGLVDEHPDFEEQEVTDEDGNVTTEKVQVGTTKTVKSSILLMKAAVALQEAMARIESLEARLAALES